MIPQTAAQAQIQSILDGFAGRSMAEIVLGLDRINDALARLGNPHHRLPPVIHVAGTNGKGSTCAYMRAVLSAAGLRVHAFTSPHLVKFNERITVGGEMISDDLLASVLGRCEAAAGDLPLSYFEAVTAAAFLAFAEVEGDAVILETGLGGRLDSTNVVDAPRGTVITPIAYDHQSWLGETIEQIAGEKAGIIKPGAAFITGRQRSEALEVLRSKALAVGAIPHVHGEEWHARVENGRLVYEDDSGLLDLSMPRLVGAHQAENAGLAVAALKACGMAPGQEKISEGLESAYWPARMQRLTKGPLVDLAVGPDGEMGELWLDGGHNPHAARALARTLADLDERSPRPIILISGLQANKDAPGFFEAFEDIASMVYTVDAKGPKPVAAPELAKIAQGAGVPAKAETSVAEAVTRAMAETIRSGEGTPRILICGSLYLAGAVLEDHS